MRFITIAILFLLNFSLQASIPFNKDGIPSLAPLLKKATPGVVNIATRIRINTQDNPLFNDPFFRHFFELPEVSREKESLGSGVIIDTNKGYIITNYHVIKGASEITVTLYDEREFKAKLIGMDKETDIALIQISADNLQSLPLGNSDALEVGDFVIAIGNPFGLNQTVTSGIVSGLERSGLNIEGYEDFIQTDASINPGNSGGALINLKGELIGINTAIYTPQQGNVGIGFAIPVAMVKQILPQLINYGEVKRGRLGVLVQTLTLDLAQALKIPNNTKGAVVVEVEPNSGAANAGIKRGDVIIAVNGKPIKSSNKLRNLIGLLPVGMEVDITIMRMGKVKAITAKIKN